MIVDIDKLTKSNYIDKSVDARIVQTTLEFVHDAYLKPLLRGLYDALNVKDYDDYNDFEKTLYDKYVLHIVGWYTQAELQIPVSFKTKQSGIVQITGDNHNTLSLNDVKMLKQHYLDKAEMYVMQCREYLQSQGFYPKDVKYKHCPIKL